MGDDDDDDEEYRSSPASMNGFPAKARPKAKKAWKSGSMLVRPRADNGSERVARTMYIYLVGNQKMEVELLVGPPGSQVYSAAVVAPLSIETVKDRLYSLHTNAQAFLKFFVEE